MYFNVTISLYLLLVGFSVGSCQDPDRDEVVTKFFQDLLDNKKADLTGRTFQKPHRSNYLNRQLQIYLRNPRVDGGYNKDSLSNLAAEVTTKDGYTWEKWVNQLINHTIN